MYSGVPLGAQPMIGSPTMVPQQPGSLPPGAYTMVGSPTMAPAVPPGMILVGSPRMAPQPPPPPAQSAPMAPQPQARKAQPEMQQRTRAAPPPVLQSQPPNSQPARQDIASIGPSRVSPTNASRQSFDQGPPGDFAGVGIFFQIREGSEAAFVQSIVPGSAADRCGVIKPGDEILAVGEEGEQPTNIQGQGLSALREKILGKQGTFALLHFRRGDNKEYFYDVELMRGSPEFIEMMNVSSSLRERQQNDMLRIQELEAEVLRLKSQVGNKSKAEDPRIGPLEDELRARMDDLRRFEDMLTRARQATAKAEKERNEAVAAADMLRDQVEQLQRQVSQGGAPLPPQPAVVREVVVERNDAGRGEIFALKDQQISSLEQQLEQLRQEIRTRNQRDQDLCRRLKSGHSVIAQAVKDQRQAAQAALDMLPSVDLVHSSMLGTLSMEMSDAAARPDQLLSTPSDPFLHRAAYTAPTQILPYQPSAASAYTSMPRMAATSSLA